MHSLWSRLNALFAFTSTVLAAATFLVFLQSIFLEYSVPADLAIQNIRLKPVHDYASFTGRSDVAGMTFTMKADLNPVFNWNVKMLYVWLQGEYNTEDKHVQLVIWDQYYYRFGGHRVNEINGRPQFYFQDDGTHLRGARANFTLHWTVVPNAGWMRNVAASGMAVVDFPNAYSK